ncbi:MAG: histidine phosphatase family protein [Tabrizicola flagellatus]|uniref:histidine phosphatase family protein n=1 Tax=Tabrizicola flagellatus TaxID=2593021 RepID=UPI00391C1438
MTAPRRIIFVTHAEVEIDPHRPVQDWPLNALGRERHETFSHHDILQGVTAIYSSDERKARDGAEIHAAHLGLVPRVLTMLGENDRSATGYLPQPEFEDMANTFFANPDCQVRGWESARAAQARIISAVRTLAELETSQGDILIVSHGAVGTLLRCACLGRAISRSEDQPAGGGNYFVIQLPDWMTHPEWRTI